MLSLKKWRCTRSGLSRARVGKGCYVSVVANGTGTGRVTISIYFCGSIRGGRRDPTHRSWAGGASLTCCGSPTCSTTAQQPPVAGERIALVPTSVAGRLHG